MASSDHTLKAETRIDPSIGDPDLENCFLSVQAGEKRLSYCILDGQRNRYIGAGEISPPMANLPEGEEVRMPTEAFISTAMAELPLLSKQFRDCKLIWEGQKSTLVPETFFRESDQEKLLSFNAKTGQEETVFNDYLKAFHAFNIFSIPEKVNGLLKHSLGVDRAFHLLSVLVESISQNYRGQLSRPKVFLNIRETWFDLVVMDHETLHYVNMFEFRHPEDLVYFTIFVMEQLELNAEQTVLVLMGKIAKDSPLYRLIFKYLHKVEFARRNATYHYSNVFHDIPPHTMFPLINLNQCGL